MLLKHTLKLIIAKQMIKEIMLNCMAMLRYQNVTVVLSMVRW